MFTATGGRVGRRLPGVDGPMLLLTTIGRRSGNPHTVPLLYLAINDNFVVIASWGGRDYPPHWFTNLEHTPQVHVQIGTSLFSAVARVATDGERPQLWSQAIATYPGYATYQARTTRLIPLVWLIPTTSGPDASK
jgi:deazaflavin-dependent oxidoreductase (nitroreductase family)